MKETAIEFLANKRVAVTGVSRNARGHGANLIYQRLRQRGYQVFAVNPNADEVEGDPC
jgi:predicted CoA-binding protein